MRQFYLQIIKGRTMCDQLQWSHYRYLLPIIDNQAYNYYIMITKDLNLSVRELRERIKSKEYERIGKDVDIEKPKVNTLIKNPILIKVKNKNEKLTEYVLHQTILENMKDFLKELGVGFAFIGSEVKIKLGDRYNYIDFLLFNTNFNCYVVVELKINELKAEHVGQITKYINYINKNIKEPFHEETVGVIICRKDNKYVMEYFTNLSIFIKKYKKIKK